MFRCHGFCWDTELHLFELTVLFGTNSRLSIETISLRFKALFVAKEPLLMLLGVTLVNQIIDFVGNSHIDLSVFLLLVLTH